MIYRLWGDNVASMEGGESWRRHRRIIGPAYNSQLYVASFFDFLCTFKDIWRYELVWEESCRIYYDMTSSEGWDSKTSFDISAVQSFSYKVRRLQIINHHVIPIFDEF